VTVSVAADGATVWRRRRVDPAAAGRPTMVGPFGATRRQTWVVRYHHKPATLRATVRLRFAARPAHAECVLSRARISTVRTG
jgi:hypothetical protein